MKITKEEYEEVLKELQGTGNGNDIAYQAHLIFMKRKGLSNREAVEQIMEVENPASFNKSPSS